MPELDCSIWCDCATCPQGRPPLYLVTISITGGDNACCADLSVQDMALTHYDSGEPGCSWKGSISSNPCEVPTTPSITLWLRPGPPDIPDADLHYSVNMGAEPYPPKWKVQDLPGVECFLTLDLSKYTIGTYCDWPWTVSIRPAADKEDFAQCIKEAKCLDLCADDDAESGCPPPPYLGPPTTCCYRDDSGCGCEGGESDECDPCEVEKPAVPVYIIGCCPQLQYYCPGGGHAGSGNGGGMGGGRVGNCPSGACAEPTARGSFSNHALAPASAMFSRIRSALGSPLASALARGPGRINNSWGFLTTRLSIPNSGPYSLPLALVYNSLGAGDTNPYGRGWYANLALQIDEDFVLDTVRLTNGLGIRWNYVDKDGSGLYLPGNHDISLKDNGDDTYTATAPDGTKYEFGTNSGGGHHYLSRIENAFGSIWTFSFDGSNLSSIRDPTDGRTTVSYGTHGIDKITDPFGRETTFDVDNTSCGV